LISTRGSGSENIKLVIRSAIRHAKVKDVDIYIPLLTGKPEQQWFTV